MFCVSLTFTRIRLPPFLLSRLQFDIRNANLEFVKLAEKNSKRRPPWANRLSGQRLHDWIKSLVENAEQHEFEHTWQAVDRRCQTWVLHMDFNEMKH